jgi:hypothetical protein
MAGGGRTTTVESERERLDRRRSQSDPLQTFAVAIERTLAAMPASAIWGAIANA